MTLGTFWGETYRNGATIADRNGQLNRFDEISEKSLKLSEILTESAKLPTATRYVRESLSAHSYLRGKVLVYRTFSFFGNIFGEFCSLQQKMTQNVTTMQRSGSELEYRIDYTTPIKKETGIIRSQRNNSEST